MNTEDSNVESKEEWRDVLNYEGLYEVSNTGKVRNMKGIKLKPANKAGYLTLGLSKQNIQKYKTVHSLVIEAFKGESPSPNHSVNHIDGDKKNNNIENLEWATQSEQSIHAHRIGLVKNIVGKIVIQRDPITNEIIATFKSAAEAGRKYNLHRNNISECCLGKRKNIDGMIFEYLNKEDERGKGIDYSTEEWKDITGTIYEISTFGRIYNTEKKIISYGTKANNGYIRFKVVGREGTSTIHRLVAEAFIEKKDPTYDIVDHIDGNKSNNHVSNLRWCNASQNTAFRHGKRTIRINPEDNSEEIYISLNDAAKSVNGYTRGINKAISTKEKYKGYFWKFA